MLAVYLTNLVGIISELHTNGVQASEIAYRMLYFRGYVPMFRNGQVLVFGAAMVGFCCMLR